MAEQITNLDVGWDNITRCAVLEASEPTTLTAERVMELLTEAAFLALEKKVITTYADPVASICAELLSARDELAAAEARLATIRNETLEEAAQSVLMAGREHYAKLRPSFERGPSEQECFHAAAIRARKE